MSHPATDPLRSFIPGALAASKVGVWQTDPARDRTVGDATLAAMFGVDPAEAAAGLPLIAYVKKVHPEDRSTLYDKLADVRARGGLFVIEYRTCPAPNVVRWVLARGCYERDQPGGGLSGRGIIIDITENKVDGDLGDRAVFIMPRREDLLDHIAERALETRRMIDNLDDAEKRMLRPASEAFLWQIGRAIALGMQRSRFRRPRRH